jgi:hypothetical protein
MGFQQTPGDNLANLANGPGWVFYTTDLTVAVPTKIDDIVGMATPYTPKTGWVFGGAVTRDAMTVARTLTATDFMTGHTNVPIGRRVTDTTRIATINFQEMSPAIQQIIEASPAIETIAVGLAASGTPAQTRLRLGGIQTLPRRRLAIVGERDPSITGVTGEGGARGQLFAYVLFQVCLTATASTFSIDPDTVSSRPVELEAFPETTLADVRQQHGMMLFETGAIVP